MLQVIGTQVWCSSNPQLLRHLGVALPVPPSLKLPTSFQRAAIVAQGRAVCLHEGRRLPAVERGIGSMADLCCNMELGGGKEDQKDEKNPLRSCHAARFQLGLGGRVLLGRVGVTPLYKGTGTSRSTPRLESTEWNSLEREWVHVISERRWVGWYSRARAKGVDQEVGGCVLKYGGGVRIFRGMGGVSDSGQTVKKGLDRWVRIWDCWGRG
eukprot:768713-Hanusia_phi.AAC.3